MNGSREPTGPRPIWTHINAASAITLLGMLLGLTSLVLTVHGHLDIAVILLAFCIVCDRLDGAVARRLGQVGQFGAELDNLSDSIVFGVAPAFFVYLVGGGGFMALPAAFLVTTAVLRLARYSLVGLTERNGKKYFVGLPVPYTAASLVLLWPLIRETSGTVQALLLALYAVALGLLMVSRLPIRKGAPVEKYLLYGLFPLILLYLALCAAGVISF
ncbi:MAG: CDP-alcohol phosphatidyltransferase family protein [Bradymonadales bacterium]|nr:CDP-alcohol phosphatidyltransferase family protein [Bradymonadales bacterium]